MVRVSALCVLVLMVGAGQHAGAADLKFTTVAGHGGLPLNVAETGNPNGRPILFLHGMAMSLQSFQPQFESELAREFLLVAFDLRGHGNSGKPWRPEDVQPPEVWADDVAAVIKGAGLRRPVIVAWSFGGFVAADYIRKYGIADIAALNLVASNAGLVPAPPPVGNLSPEDMKQRAVMQGSGNLLDNLTVVEATTKMFEFPGMTPAYRDQMYSMGVMVPAYFRRAFAGHRLDHLDVTAGLTLPVLVTMGSRDIAQSPGPFDALQKAMPKAKFSVYDGVGHLPFAQDPARFNRELAEFARAAPR